MTKEGRTNIFRLRDDLEQTTEKAVATIEMLYHFMKYKDELNELALSGADFILENTLEDIELLRMKFNQLIKEVDNEK